MMKSKKLFDGFLLKVLLISVAIMFFPVLMVAQITLKGDSAPINPDFTKYMENLRAGNIEEFTDSGYPLGLIPSPIDRSYMKSEKVSKPPALRVPPASYDLRTASPARLTPIKDQLLCGSCWAFATYGSLESCQQTQSYSATPPDYSENNLKNTHGFDKPCCSGGNFDMSTAYLAKWAGPIAEASDVYNGSDPNPCSSPGGLSPVKHIQKVIYLPGRQNSTDNDTIKNAVMTYGAVSILMRWEDAYYNNTNRAYYYSGGSTTTNHGVCIVGWDNSFDRTKFPIPYPTANGAFIVRNNWGSTWGEAGYFFASYEDKVLSYNTNSVFVGIEPTNNFNVIYQYDPFGWTTAYGYGSSTAYFANKFTATSSDPLKAAGFYVTAPNSSYELWAYLNPNAGPINTDGIGVHKSGTIADAGYNTIVFDTPLALFNGQTFSVVVKLTTTGYGFPIPLEQDLAGYSSSANASAGQSYVSLNGVSYVDITTEPGYSKTNVCLKAYAGGTTSVANWQLY